EDWAFRPKVEDVLENLEDFFPEYDLEKPVFDAPTPTPITPSPDTTSPAREQAPAKATLKRASAQLGYKKSIRVVAGDRKRNMLKASAREKQQPGLASNVPASVMRRKSTKLFGSRLEEVTPSQVKQMDPTIPESPPDDDPDNFSFKWIKGEMIGRGSYGKVYIAFNVTAGEAIAVKQVELPRTASDKEDKRLQGMVASLKAEIELLKDLSHDNIVEYLGMEETPEYLSIFLEYVPGGSVGRIIRTHGKFPEDVIKHFTFQILTGLRYLHNLGILHRDLKGDNILCDQDGVCKISDFGTSKKSQDIYNNDVNMSMQGSIFWMAPEVIQNESRGYSAKADIWSLGCLCLEMFAGRRPWDQNEILATMFKLGAEKRAPPVPDDVILSDLAKAFFNACFQGDPDLRPRADQLMRHRFLELGPDYAFTKTSLYKYVFRFSIY
ncbi:kinase-like protein, partial [Meredithblackwellia eburnea MCA 4105]